MYEVVFALDHFGLMPFSLFFLLAVGAGIWLVFATRRRRLAVASDGDVRRPLVWPPAVLLGASVFMGLAVLLAPVVLSPFVIEPAGGQALDRAGGPAREQVMSVPAAMPESSRPQASPAQADAPDSSGGAAAASVAPTAPVVPAAPASSEPLATRPDPLGVLSSRHAGLNPWVDAELDNLSTFSLDGDTASYDIARLFVRSHAQLPDPGTVRVEDFVNAFGQGYERPAAGLGLALDGGPSPFGPAGVSMLRVGVVSPAPDPASRVPVSLILLVDTSGSMEGMGAAVSAHLGSALVDALRPGDHVSLISYSAHATVRSVPVPFSQVGAVRSALAELVPSGSTNIEAGLELAYLTADLEVQQGRRAVRIVLISDGVGNVGRSAADELRARLTGWATRDVTLTAVGVGHQNYDDAVMEALANWGNGTYHYVRSIGQAHAFVDRGLAGLFHDAPLDARVQVEFNPAAVLRYRLIGYENRAVADSDFRSDDLDFGEPGFARDVTALYEIELAEGVAPLVELATARVRWRMADSDETAEFPRSVAVGSLADDFRDLPAEFRRAAAAAELAEVLRGSPHGDCQHLTGVANHLAGVPELDIERAAVDAQGAELLDFARSVRALAAPSCP